MHSIQQALLLKEIKETAQYIRGIASAPNSFLPLNWTYTSLLKYNPITFGLIENFSLLPSHSLPKAYNPVFGICLKLFFSLG